MKKTCAPRTIAILLATAVASCAAQVVPTGQQASPTVQQTQGFVVHGSARSISLPPIPGQSADSSPLQLSATDSAGLPVTFATLTPSACTVSNNVVTYLSSGTCSIAADRGENGMFVSASKVTPNLSGCTDCLPPPPQSIPTLPQWCAIVMGLVLIGLSLFLMRRSKASPIA
ncbi:MAG: hypothetical protein ACLPY1_02345 [Terracidiphilus sp.]